MKIENRKSINEHLCQYTVSRQQKSLLVPENYKLYLTLTWWPAAQHLKMVQSSIEVASKCCLLMLLVAVLLSLLSKSINGGAVRKKKLFMDRSEVRFLFYTRTVRSRTGTKSNSCRVSHRDEVRPVWVHFWVGKRMKRNRLLILISLFSLKIDFNCPLLILRVDFWCVATVGRRSWQVVREAKNAVSIAVKKLKLPCVKLRNCREQIEINCGE